LFFLYIIALAAVWIAFSLPGIEGFGILAAPRNDKE
jgi:hypothetical protein